MPAAAVDADAVAALARSIAEAITAQDATAPGVAAAAGGEVEDDGPPLGLRARPDVAGVEEVSVTRKWDSDEPNAADIRLSPGLSLADVEQRLGAASSVPSTRPGRHLVVLGEQDVPATIFAVLGDEDGVRSLTVRRDN